MLTLFSGGKPGVQPLALSSQPLPCAFWPNHQVRSESGLPGRVHTDARNRMSKGRAKKLVKVYFNGRALAKARKVECESQAFMWNESEPLPESEEYISETPHLTPVLTGTNRNLSTP